MKKSLLYSLFILTVILNTGCGENPDQAETDAEKANTDSTAILPDQHNSANSLDWGGTYKGVTPCADCEGIETVLTLNQDNSYSIKTKYLGKADKAIEKKGSFIWNNAGNTVTLLGIERRPNQYFVGENKLIQLDMSGNKITGELTNKYVLKKH